MDNFPTSNEDLKAILEQNLAYTKEIHKTVRKIHHYHIFSQVMGIVYLILIIGPIILGIIYLPDLLKTSLNSIIPGGLEQSPVLKEILNNNSINK